MEMILYWLLIIIMFAGAVGELIPGVPGVTVVLGGILVWSVVTQFAGIGWPLFIVLALLLLSSAIEAAAFFFGAKQFGATRWGQIGAVIGLLIGLLGLLPALPLGGPILGALVGPFLGAFIGEYLHHKSLPFKERWRVSLKASLGTILGAVVGNLVDGAIAIIAVIIFVFNTWPLMASLA